MEQRDRTNAVPDRPPEGFRWECRRSTCCCRRPGFVRVDENETRAIADFLGLTEHAFIQQFTRLRPQRNGLALTEQPDGACVFLDGRDCRIQPVKPRQCRDFPNRWNFPGWRAICQAELVPVSEAAEG